ncbi:cobalamin B12-binding domain-containing protein [Natranaerofaba carboxydovora]|uniref:cobalamin B12-binding domain-containing protein n=1 Tax=Natranaerofaba carboxydovora TaxID=2742683 RepID=UPI001F140F47|nr:cobalamin-dependent protein [Natranaerofaba carboxydovora]UMZ74756.1 Methionine synthase [Natranaerofaba carboxydovora]
MLELEVSLKNAVVSGEMNTIDRLVNKLIGIGIDEWTILTQMTKGLEIAGDKYNRGESPIHDFILAGDTMRQGLEVVLPRIGYYEGKVRGRVVLGVVQGDMHELGKNIVKYVLQGGGYRVYDIGVDIPPYMFAKKIKEKNADIVGASAYTTTTSYRLREVSTALEEEGIRDKVKYLIGGSAVSEEHVNWTGADGFAKNAKQAVLAADKLMSKELIL